MMAERDAMHHGKARASIDGRVAGRNKGIPRWKGATHEGEGNLAITPSTHPSCKPVRRQRVSGLIEQHGSTPSPPWIRCHPQEARAGEAAMIGGRPWARL